MVSLLSSISSEVSLVQVLTASDVRTFENWRNWIVLHETYYVNRRWKKSDNLWKLRFSIRKFQVIQEILKKCCFREKMLAAYPNVYLRRITLHLKDAFRYIKFRIYKTIVLIGQSSALPTVIRLSPNNLQKCSKLAPRTMHCTAVSRCYMADKSYSRAVCAADYGLLLVKEHVKKY